MLTFGGPAEEEAERVRAVVRGAEASGDGGLSRGIEADRLARVAGRLRRAAEGGALWAGPFRRSVGAARLQGQKGALREAGCIDCSSESVREAP